MYAHPSFVLPLFFVISAYIVHFVLSHYDR